MQSSDHRPLLGPGPTIEESERLLGPCAGVDESRSFLIGKKSDPAARFLLLCDVAHGIAVGKAPFLRSNGEQVRQAGQIAVCSCPRALVLRGRQNIAVLVPLRLAAAVAGASEGVAGLRDEVGGDFGKRLVSKSLDPPI